MLEKLFFVFLGWWLSEFAKVFSSTDKALMVIKTSSSEAEKCTNELTNLAKLLNKSELYWQQSIYRLFLLRAKSTLQL